MCSAWGGYPAVEGDNWPHIRDGYYKLIAPRSVFNKLERYFLILSNQPSECIKLLKEFHEQPYDVVSWKYFSGMYNVGLAKMFTGNEREISQRTSLIHITKLLISRSPSV